jgi:plastocyanin
LRFKSGSYLFEFVRGLFFLLLLTPAAEAGTITGTVRAHGKEGADQQQGSGAYESRKLKFAPKVDYAELKDFVVYIDQEIPGLPEQPAQIQRIVVQKDAVFRPHVLPVIVGGTVEWPNEDDIYHNVFSFSDPKSFDLGLYRDDVKRVTFGGPGRVDVYCSIHKDMHCIILVLQNPFFAVVNAGGRFALKDVPAGTYKLKAWHERLPPQVREIVVPENGDVEADFDLGITGLPEY